MLTARAIVALLPLLILAVSYISGHQPSGWLVALGVGYLVATLLTRLRLRTGQPWQHLNVTWALTAGVDLLVFTGFHAAQLGALSYTPLFALPVLLASLFGSRLLALGTAALASLLLLAEVWRFGQPLSSELAARYLQVGFSGLGFFMLALLTHQLASWLLRQEQIASQNQRLASLQGQVNQLVIDSLRDGVLVVDEQGEIHAANPVAKAMLNLWVTPAPRPAVAGQRPTLHSKPAYAPLLGVALATMRNNCSQIHDISLSDEEGHCQALQVQTHPISANVLEPERLCVIFLQDLQQVQARVRTEKLAAMGRMSAAVAHEIRNPLAAIAQANSLLAEDLQRPTQQQLSNLITQNAQRLARVVDDVLNVARAGTSPTPEWLLLDESVRQICQDWQSQNPGAPTLNLTLTCPGIGVVFEPEHLRRVLVNLLDNAKNHGSPQSQTVYVSTHRAYGQDTQLHVRSSGAALAQHVQRHLFEPFFSSNSRSSGLGLYICRELCERHGAVIGYRPNPAPEPQGHVFFIQFAHRAFDSPVRRAATPL